jgi:hypothetical protein
MKGFAHPSYVSSLAEFGDPLELPRCGGWIIERPILGFSCRDAMGCYPLFVCRDWSQLHLDLQALPCDIVSVSLVTDPFAQYDPDLLLQCFDIVFPFKSHFVADLSRPIDTIVSAHHRKYTRKAFKNIQVDVCEDPIRYLDEWTDLYASLAAKFNIKGLRAFSRASFEKQLSVPGAVMFRALYQGTAVAAHLVYAHDEVCYGHLAGINSVGHELLASYALYWTEIEYFAGKARWFDWGACAGIKGDEKNGLAQFKRGWATETRTSYFCGRILDKERYEEIINVSGKTESDYFPAYREGEFE